MLLCHTLSSYTYSSHHVLLSTSYYPPCALGVHFNGNTVALFWHFLNLFNIFFVCHVKTSIFYNPVKEAMCVIVRVVVCWPDSCSLTHYWAVNHFLQEVEPQQARRVSTLHSQLQCYFLQCHIKTCNVGRWEIRTLSSFPQPRTFSYSLYWEEEWSEGHALMRFCEILKKYNMEWKLGLYF